MQDRNDDVYYSRRESAERAAAKRASCDAARRAHQELAQIYADRRSAALHGC